MSINLRFQEDCLYVTADEKGMKDLLAAVSGALNHGSASIFDSPDGKERIAILLQDWPERGRL